LRAALDPWLGAQLPYIFVFGAIIVATWYGGLVPALIAAAVGYLAADWLFVEPRHVPTLSWAPAVGYWVSVLLIAALGAAMHRARSRAERSEARLRDFMDHSPAYVLIKDEAGRYAFLNRAAEELLGVAPGEWQGKTGADLLPEALAAEVARHDREVLETDAATSFEARLPRADGERHFYTSKFPLRDAAGRRLVASVAIDVTEQRRAEEERQLEREQLRIVTDTMSVAAARVSAERRYLWANRVYAEWVGMRAEDIAGRTVAEVLGADALAQIAPHVEQVLKGRQVEYERFSTFPGRGLRWVHAALAPTFDAAGRTNGFVVALADIDELKRAQEQLQLILSVIPAAVQRCSRELRFMWLNPLWAQWLGRRAEEVVGQRMDDVLPAAVIREIRPYIERVLAGETVRYERLAEIAGRGARWIEVMLVPADDGFVSIGSDVHERKLAEAQIRDAERRKDEFLALLAHELRNPLAPIRNAVALLRKKSGLDAEVTWSRELIERQVDQLSRLVGDLLDIERIARGRLLVQKEPVSLEKLIDLALETSRPHVHAAGHHLSVVLPTERVMLHADAARLAQVLATLIGSAGKRTASRGRIALSAALEASEVVVMLETSGEPQDPGPEGADFSLTLAQGILALHGGTMELPRGSEGSRYIVRLPVTASEESVPARAPLRQQAAAFRILVADDNRDAADSLQRILEVYGHDVRVAYDGAAALQLGESFRPRVAVLDIGMPGRNGYDVARAMRTQQEAPLTLVALTGWGQEADRRRALDAGFDYHLTKPVDPEALNELLAELGSD
jgi:two-component system CheB/CheR fusion protein